MLICVNGDWWGRLRDLVMENWKMKENEKTTKTLKYDLAGLSLGYSLRLGSDASTITGGGKRQDSKSRTCAITSDSWAENLP